MAHEWLERDDLSVFVVAGVPKSFNRELQQLVQKEHGDEAVSLRVHEDLAPWILTRVRGHYRPTSSASLASNALWRAFRALAAARYHVRGDPKLSQKLRELRDQVEKHWAALSPMNRTAGD
jgi:hypothetical protein